MPTFVDSHESPFSPKNGKQLFFNFKCQCFSIQSFHVCCSYLILFTFSFLSVTFDILWFINLLMWMFTGILASSLVAEVADGSSNVREVWKLHLKWVWTTWKPQNPASLLTVYYLYERTIIYSFSHPNFIHPTPSRVMYADIHFRFMEMKFLLFLHLISPSRIHFSFLFSYDSKH